MKKPIEWHLECLENRHLSLAKKKEALERAQQEYARASDKVDIYKMQIRRAINEGLNGFDRDRFRVGKVRGGNS